MNLKFDNVGVEGHILIKDNSILLMEVLEARAMPSTTAISSQNEFLRCLGPRTIASVLSAFSNKKWSETL